MPRVPVRLQVKTCKCSKETIPSLKFRLWFENSTQVPCFQDRLKMKRVKEIDLHKIKLCWGKSGSSSGGGGGKTCTGIFWMQNLSQAKGGEAKNLKDLGRLKGISSFTRSPDHICYSNTECICSVFYQVTEQFPSIVGGLNLFLSSVANVQVPVQYCRDHSCISSLFWICPTLGNFRGTHRQKSILKRVKNRGTQMKTQLINLLDKRSWCSQCNHWGLNIFLWASSPPWLQ